MKLRLLAAVIGFAMATGAAHAQIGLYATPIVSRISNSTPDTSVFAFLGTGSTSRIFEGFGIGVYDDFYHAPRFDAGLDVRGNIMRGAGAQLNNFLLGGRVAFKPVSFPVKPYVELLGGVGGSKAAHNPLYVSKAEYNVSAGADYPLGKRVDWRVLEIGYGSVQTISSGIENGTSGALPPASKLINFSTGIVIRVK